MDSLQSVTTGALSALLRLGPLSQGKLELAWRLAVGDALSRVSSVRLRADGSVEVHPSDQRWRKELQRSSSMILARLKGLLGADAVPHLHVK